MSEIASSAACRPSRAVLLDYAEKAFLLGLYAWLVWRIVGNYFESGNAISLLLLPSEGLVALFVLIRRGATEVSNNPLEWLFAVGGSTLPLLVVAVPGASTLVGLGAMLLLAGTAIQVWAKLSLRRSFGMVPALRGVKTGGPYRCVRHPMYAGYAISHVGFLLVNPVWWNAALYVMATACQIARLLAEEKLLSTRSLEYRAFCRQVRYRLIPGVL